MKTRRRPVLVAASIGMVALVLLGGLIFARPARAAADSGDTDSITIAIRDAHFTEPLVVTKPTAAAEDVALARALAAYAQRAKPDDVGSLTAFLSKYPHSGWAPAL